jgi:hypothetical protein
VKKPLLIAVLFAASPLFAATKPKPAPVPVPTAAPEASGNLVSGALIEALIAIEKPELGGVFSYVNEKNAPRAFADLLARDPKSMKRYADKLKADMKAAGGTTAWDHEVCATLVNYYAGPPMPGLKAPDAKRLKALNETVLSPVKDLQEIVMRRGQ